MYICHMELQTIVHIDPPESLLSYRSHIMMLGSCFVENIGAKLEYFHFDVDINPCGIVYNPESVASTLDILLDRKIFKKDDLWYHNGLWGSFSHHGHFSACDADECLAGINSRIIASAERLQSSDLLVITWGTAWVYEYLKTGIIVSNCHKFPATAFRRFRLKVDAIVERYVGLLEYLHCLNPRMKVLFTVSPIRHWKDGAHGNQLSKSVLHLAIDELVQRFDFVSYFPSYEIVMDELRDYRFYAEDMLHISPQGVSYIWEKFRDLYFEPEAILLMRKVDKLNKMLAHRPLNPNSEEALRLHAQAQQDLDALLEKVRK